MGEKYYGELIQKYGELSRIPQEDGQVQGWESVFWGGTYVLTISGFQKYV